jgi:hypothetical protein
MIWRWRKRVQQETDTAIEQGKQAAETGARRLEEVRRITRKGAEIRKKDEHLKRTNQFVETFMRSLKEGLR